MQRLVLATGILACLVVALAAQAQVPSDSGFMRTHVLRTRDGSTLVGRIVAETPDSIRFESLGVVFAVSRAQIRSLDTLGVREQATRSKYAFAIPIGRGSSSPRRVAHSTRAKATSRTPTFCSPVSRAG